MFQRVFELTMRTIRQPIFSIMLAAAALVGVSQPADAQSAQDREERSDTTGQNAAPGIVVGNTVFLSSAEVGTGYDSNLDGRVQEQGSAFAKLEAGLRADSKWSDGKGSARVRVRNYEYFDLDKSHRWDLDAALGAEFNMGANASLKVGTSYYRDKIALDSVDIFSSFADYQLRNESYKMRFKLLSDTQLATSDGLDRAITDPDVFDVARGPAFDHTKNGGEVSVLLWPKAVVAPFLFGGAFDVDYFHQVADPSLDRNARYVFGIAGFRVNIGPKFFVDLGLRRNDRFFDDVDVSHFGVTAFDGRFEWRATDDLKVKGIVERVVRETTAAFGLADDVQRYRLTAEQRIGDKLFVIADAYFDDVRPISDNIHYNKYTAKLTGSYRPTPNLEYYVEGLARHVKELNFDSEYSRLRVEAGARLKF